MNIKNLVKNIKGLIVFFSICFLGIMVYLTYFMIYKSQWVVKDVTNPRIRAEEESIIRGSILDRNGKKIVYNEVQKNGKQKRIYINGQMFALVIGYSSYIYGKTGIEQGYDDILLGKSLNSDVLGVIFRSLKENISGSPKRGYNLQLTIDTDVQRTAYNMLGQDKGAVVAVNPKTGEIIALVSRPSFDPENIDELFDKYKNDTSGTPFVNRASEGYYPPGSVFKIVTAAAALEDLPNIRKEVLIHSLPTIHR
jgi:peptidoglycan glycosyltransferase